VLIAPAESSCRSATARARRDDVRFIRGNDRIHQLAQRPDIADEVAQIRADMADADRTHAVLRAAAKRGSTPEEMEPHAQTREAVGGRAPTACQRLHRRHVRWPGRRPDARRDDAFRDA